MKIAVIGTGYVGLTVGVCLADFGNEVICVDIDESKVEKLNNGIPTIYEPGLTDLLKRNLEEKRVSFTTDTRNTVENSEVIFIAVGTPEGEDGRADLRFVKEVAKEIGTYMNNYKIIVNKSTVPVGTAELVKEIVKESQKEPIEFDVVSNPEFLRQGSAIRDFTVPDRVVIGADSEKARDIMNSIYKGIARADKPILFTDVKSAELIKYASNAMLATRISFMNEMAHLCEKVGADVKTVAKGVGLDNRIGPRFLQAGIGYGGSCFSKDVKALIQTMKDNAVNGKILKAVEDVNQEQKKSLLPKIKQLIPDLRGKTIAVWGLAFKPKTDDLREAPSLILIEQLQKEGAKIKAFDPEAKERAKGILQDVVFSDTPHEAVKEADGLVVVTEWNEFRDIDKSELKDLMSNPNIIDGRNIYEPDEMRKHGFNYLGVGRK